VGPNMELAASVRKRLGNACAEQGVAALFVAWKRAAMDEPELRARLFASSEEHRDLDAAIEALRTLAGADALQIARMKKRKLRLKDEIQVLNDMLIPDIIA